LFLLSFACASKRIARERTAEKSDSALDFLEYPLDITNHLSKQGFELFYFGAG
jgi:hypothetical protein